MRDDPLLSLPKKGASTLRQLTLEPEYLRSEDIVTCLRLANQVSHLVLGSARRFISTWTIEDLVAEEAFHLNLLAIHNESESQNNLLPKLEVLEVNHFRQFPDEGILWLLTNLAAARRGDVSPLRHLKLLFSREMQKDIKISEKKLLHVRKLLVLRCDWSCNTHKSIRVRQIKDGCFGCFEFHFHLPGIRLMKYGLLYLIL